MLLRTDILATLIIAVIVLHQGQTTPAIGFSAAVSKNTNLGDNQAVQYDRVLTNIGNGYDKWSGHFTAPLKGLYHFSCSVMAVGDHYIAVMMVKNGKGIAYAHSSWSAWESGAMSVVLALKKGDKVWIRRYHGDRFLHGSYNLFSGYLISRQI
uniref:C1q domain-containing protein n=1 Tax=Magallana gigas TaxID=29159 RepID=A0A8W8LMF2_MAGGI